MSEWLTVRDAAEALGVPAWEILTLIHTGELEAERCVPGLCTFHVTEDSLEEYIAKNLRAPKRLKVVAS